MLRARRIADYITAQKNRVRVQCAEERARRVGGKEGEGERCGEVWRGGAVRLNDLGLARAAAKVSVQRYTVIIRAPTSLPAHTLSIVLQCDAAHNRSDAH